ncbi:MAG: oligosaccharide flippase family protein [Planctomycetes bacterium]|nr:oligosaccharide flippase family protein [Planctomycetota bacterium]
MRALRRRALGGSAWTIAGYAASNVLRLAGNIILARLLFPEAFGLMAIIHVFIQGLWLFTDVGISPAIVQSPRGDDPRYLNTAWTFQLVRGTTLCLISFLIAWPVAALYSGSEPLARDLIWYLPVTGLSALLDGAVSTRVFVYGRHLRIRQLTFFELTLQLGSLLVMVGFAWVHPSVWALVAGALTKSALRLVISHTLLEGPANRPAWDPAAARALFTFGKWVFVSTMLTFLATQADRLIFGGLVPWSLLGVYGIAAALAAMPVGALLQVGTKVVFPTLSRLRDREAELLREARRVRLPLLLGGGALVSAMLPAGPALIGLLYDARYADAGWILQLLLLGAWFQVLEAPNTALLLARGETRAVAAGNLAKLLGILGLLPAGFWLAGFPGALVGLALADACKYATTSGLVRLRGLRFVRLDVSATALVLVACALGLGAEALAGGPTPVGMVAGGLTGVAPWAAAAGLAWRVHAGRGAAGVAAPA